MLNNLEIVAPLIAVILVILPLWFMFRRGTPKNAKAKLLAQIAIFAGVLLITVIVNIHSFTALAEDAAAAGTTSSSSMGFLAAALSVSASSLGAAWAVAAAAPAAIGAISENAENFGKAIIFVALGEGIAIYGLLISILIINKL